MPIRFSWIFFWLGFSQTYMSSKMLLPVQLHATLFPLYSFPLYLFTSNIFTHNQFSEIRNIHLDLSLHVFFFYRRHPRSLFFSRSSSRRSEGAEDTLQCKKCYLSLCLPHPKKTKSEASVVISWA